MKVFKKLLFFIIFLNIIPVLKAQCVNRIQTNLTINTCSNSVNFSPIGRNGLTASIWEWNFGDPNGSNNIIMGNWTNLSNVSHTYQGPGTYTARFTFGSPCDELWVNGVQYPSTIASNGDYQFTVVFIVTIGVAPTIDLVSESISCNGTTATVSLDINARGGTPPYSYQWSNGIGTEDLNNVRGTATAYCVSVKDANGCKTVKCFDCLNPCSNNSNFAPTPIRKVQNSNQGIDTPGTLNTTPEISLPTHQINPIVSAKTNLKAFPNPFNTEISLDWANTDSNRTSSTVINLYNTIGQLVKTKSVDAKTQNTKIELGSLPKGVYRIALVQKGVVVATTEVFKN